MKKRLRMPHIPGVSYVTREVTEFVSFLFYYSRKKTVAFSVSFEKNKNRLVKVFIMKRGKYNRPFLHLTTMAVLGIGVMIAPFLADTYPIFSKPTTLDLTASAEQEESIFVGEEIFETEISEKPRDKVITYTVEKGDTISTIAKKFGISENTVKWANDLTEDSLSIGDELKILPVTGVLHKVLADESIHSIAKKYDTEAQKIADFPFNEFAGNGESFALVEGQLLVIPDGIKPSEQPYIKRTVYLAQNPAQVSAGGYTFPVRGEISQSYSWFHRGLDIVAPYGTPIVASHNGTVVSINVGSWDGGYGTNVWISTGDGTRSHYAHMSGVNVSLGQRVIGGQTTIGWIGMTGRTTGPHVHFEMERGGGLINPLGYLQ
ncbi:MAG: M23 family metallopeptidase [Patescibacteria group bacterium]